LDELLGAPTPAYGTGYNESTIVHNLQELWNTLTRFKEAYLALIPTVSSSKTPNAYR